MQKNMKKLKRVLSVLIAVIMLLSVVSCGDKNTASVKDVKIVLCEFNGKVDFHSQLQTEYILGKYDEISKFADGTKELSIPDGVTINWSLEGNSNKVVPTEYELLLSKNESFENAKSVTTTETEVKVNNLNLDQEYYYKVIAKFNDVAVESDVKSFYTVDYGPRNLSVAFYTPKGSPMYTTNVRDIGGWKVGDKKVKQDLLFRCANPKTVMKDAFKEFNVKTEIDLRSESETTATKSVLTNVVYYHFPMTYSGNILLNNKEILPNVFEVLGDKDNYPMIFHCSIGTDRTGMLAYLINALLGVSKEDLARDYLYSNFGLISSNRTTSAVNQYDTEINKFTGETYSEKTKKLLLSYGVRESDINSLIGILL